MIELVLKGQKLAVHTPLLVAGSKDYLTIQIHRDSTEWEDLSLHIFFQNAAHTYELLTTGDFIGTDAHLDLTAGEWSVSVVGYEFDGGDEVAMKVTTNTIGITVAPAPPDAGESLPYTPPTAYEQIEAIARSVREDADNGVFDGEKGDKGDAAFTLAIDSTITGEPGTDASVENVGTTGDQRWRITIPKGDTGDQGESITVSSTVIEYQEGASGTTAPTGAWSSTVPSVTQGNFLWTRVTTTFSDGATAVSYSVSRMGVDGSGSVMTVNNVAPDGDGNVSLSASDVGAMPDTYTAPVTSVNTKTGAVSLLYSDVKASHSESVSTQITASGWFRVLEYEAGNMPEAAGAAGFVVDFTIGKDGTSAEAHSISLFSVYGNVAFANERSVSATQLIDKIRYTYQTSSPYKGFVDIHLSSNPQAVVYADITVKTKPTYQSLFKASTLASVADAPSGETVQTTFPFIANVPNSYSYGTADPDNSDGRPNGSLYFKYVS